MGNCEMLKKYAGTKSEIIQQMINEVITKEKKKQLEKTVENKQLKVLVKNFKANEKEYSTSKDALRKKEEELGIKWYRGWDNEKGKYEVSRTCFVPKIVKEELQKASNLHALGKVKEAQTIWEKIIKEWKLVI